MTPSNLIFGNNGKNHGSGFSLRRQSTIIALLLVLLSCSACSLFGDEKKRAPAEGEITEAMLDRAAADKAAQEQELASAANTDTAVPSDDQDSAENKADPRQTTAAVVELIWKVPGGNVDKYHLTYGFSEDTLDTELVLNVSELEKMDHPEFGPVYRYILSGVPSGKDVFFTLQAENKFGISEKTPPQAAKQE